MIYKIKYEDLLELLGADKNKEIEEIRNYYKDRILAITIKDKSKWTTATQRKT